MSDRKYQQQGYRNSGRGASERPASPSERSRKPSDRPDRPAGADRADRGERPRGRGLGAPTETVFRCARCGEAATVVAAAAADARCAKCGTDLHCCINCTAFDPGAHFQCRRPIEARVSPKDRANRCDQFDPRTLQEFAQERAAPGDPKSAFDALFKI